MEHTQRPGLHGPDNRGRLNKLVSGLTASLIGNLLWLRIYVIAAAALALVHVLVAGTLGASYVLWQLAGSLAGILLITGALGAARRVQHRAPQRIFGGLTICGSVSLSLAALTIPSVLGNPLLTSTLLVVALAWAAASILILLVVLLPGISFHPDFAHLRMFRRMTMWLDILLGVFPFLVAADQLLVWPKPLESKAQNLAGYFAWLVSPTVPPLPLPDRYLSIMGAGLAALCLAMCITRLYTHLAQRWFPPDLLRTLRESTALLRQNLAYRLHQSAEPIWPLRVRPSLDALLENTREAGLQDAFLFASSLAAISLAVGLWAPKVLPDGLGHGWPDESGGLAFVVIVFLMAGGISTWLRCIDMAGVAGAFYTIGLWLGSYALYWVTTLVAVIGVSDAVLLIWALPTAPQVQTWLAFDYRAALGSVTLLIAVGQSHLLTQRSKIHQLLSHGLAFVSLAVLLSFLLGALSQQPSTVSSVPFVALAMLVIAAVVLFLFPALHPPDLVSDRLGAQLIASPSLALAPLLLNSFVHRVSWADSGFAELTVAPVGGSKQARKLRVFLAGSEDEVAFEATSKPHAGLRGHMDFVITDLRTAVEVLADYRKQKPRFAACYQIIGVVATVPWCAISLDSGAGDVGNSAIVLDSGYLRYVPSFRPAEDVGHPGNLHPDRVRLSSMATVAWYAAHRTPNVTDVILSEPYYSWVKRTAGAQRRGLVEKKEERMLVYVLLARHHGRGRPAVSFDWKRTLCDMIAEGQEVCSENLSVVNHAELHTLHDFLSQAIGEPMDLQLQDLHRGLCASHFESTFGQGSRYVYQLTISDLHHSNFLTGNLDAEALNTKLKHLSAEDVDSFLCGELHSAKVTDDEIGPPLGGFFSRYHKRPVTVSPNVEEHFVRLGLVTSPDSPGELAKILAQLSKVNGTVHLTPGFVASANLGDSALVYLMDRAALPLPGRISAAALRQPLKVADQKLGWLDAARQIDCTPTEVRALMIPIQNAGPSGGLSSDLESVLGAFSRPDARPKVNIEQFFLVELDDQHDLVLVVVKQGSWENAYYRLVQPVAPAPRGQAEQDGVPIHATEVNVKCSLTFKLNTFQALFRDIVVGHGDSVDFTCQGLSTWTPNWGGIEYWLSEIGFHEVRLRVPTALAWEICAFGWLGRLSIWNETQRRWLCKHLPGFGGEGAYRDKDNWIVKVTRCSVE